MRDLSAIGSKIVLILYPAGSSSSKAVLRDWDLWGPLVACLGLAVVLSVNGTFLCTSLSLSLSTLFDFQLPLIKMTDARLLLVFFFFCLTTWFRFSMGDSNTKSTTTAILVGLYWSICDCLGGLTGGDVKCAFARW